MGFISNQCLTRRFPAANFALMNAAQQTTRFSPLALPGLGLLLP